MLRLKKTENIKRNSVKFFVLLGLFGILSIVFAILITRQNPSLESSPKTYKNISSEWTLDEEGTQSVRTTKLGENMNVETGEMYIYYQLPKFTQDTHLVFRSKDVYTSVYVDDMLLYETNVYDSRFYNRSPGNIWNYVSIPVDCSEKIVKLKISMVYDTSAVVVDCIYLGDKTDIIFGFIMENGFGIMISVLLILLGFTLIVYDFLPAYAQVKTSHSIAWVGVFAITTGIWGLIETNTLQFIAKDVRIWQLVDNMILTLSSQILLLYMDSEYNVFKHLGMRLWGYVLSGYTLICIFVQYFGKHDWHHMLPLSLLLMAMTDSLLTIWVVYVLIKMKKEKRPLLNCAIRLSGFCALWFLIIFEIVRSLLQDRPDRAQLMRVGMLILCICLTISNQIETYKLFEQGMKYNLISKLAYSDGLTGLGNRTAYLEQIEEYSNADKIDVKLGIVYLDVNNLKVVNDTQGHEYGDELIRIAAQIIEDSFGKLGKAYRIGGDEFCVLISGANVEKKYEDGLNIFNQLVNVANNSDWYTFKIQIAHGFAVSNAFTRELVEAAVTEADEKMYENKLKLKSLV